MATKNRSVKKIEFPTDKKSEKWKSPQIDFPRDGEVVGGGHYAVRISAEGGAEVEISFDDGDWMSCRYAVGHWWFDWSPVNQGEKRLRARARVDQGKWHQSNEVRCQIA
ncbi:MAG: hypothetical protein KCHDKBKB_01768 [Elusimicrobia bacterium]|nr:hypothetical protein [Elusimicrobiota bacterium]